MFSYLSGTQQRLITSSFSPTKHVVLLLAVPTYAHATTGSAQCCLLLLPSSRSQGRIRGAVPRAGYVQYLHDAWCAFDRLSYGLFAVTMHVQLIHRAGKPALDWATRKRIAVGAARGLLYLHEQCDPKIIHRDVKAANVLLDEHHEAVVGDFGLAKLLDHGDSHVTTAVRGTVGHIAPEYLSTGQSSEKTDVFGFGILLLELVTGQRALELGKASGALHSQKGVVMLDWVRVLSSPWSRARLLFFSVLNAKTKQPAGCSFVNLIDNLLNL